MTEYIKDSKTNEELVCLYQDAIYDSDREIYLYNLILQNTGLINKFAKHDEDRRQDAIEVLINSANTFKRELKTKFSTHFVWWLRSYTSNGRNNFYNWREKLILKIQNENYQLNQEELFALVEKEFANRKLKINIHEMTRTLNRRVYSNDRRLTANGEVKGGTYSENTFADVIPGKDEHIEENLFISQMLDSLTEEERKIISLHYLDDIELDDVAKEMKLTKKDKKGNEIPYGQPRQAVWGMCKKIINKLRKKFKKE